MPVTGSYFRCKFLISLLIAVLCTTSVPASGADTGSVAVVTNRFANIRSGPGTKYTRLGRVYEGGRYPVTAMQGEWVEISYDGRPGWIFGELVSIEKAGPSQAEIDMVAIKVTDLNNRLERLMQKLGQATEIVNQRLPEQPEPAPELKMKATHPRRMPPAERVSPAWVFVPGGPRLAAGDRLRGYGLLGVTAACAGGWYYYYDQYRGYKDDYNALDGGVPVEEFDRLIDKADSRRRVSDGLLYATAGLYAINVLDYFFFLPRSMAGMQVNSAPAAGGRIKLSMSTEF